ncbi:hypothetical protein LTR56_007043 [Elasticomyces elasticus]|nr:hypothetical protein LTR56_007043 [Elasticomyces elasticus]KAK3664088.1 hypothetical protein LTR22_005052 [Elasticomyces elasticus]KAK4927657.1 hypothetical protein LTR49_005526 [Elasticomyces elasticus]KAK5767028.1 hypothetical protein LTS12_002793 [Elasticomyces elasticus]
MEGSRLLDLPPELRNRIYDLVFTTEKIIIVRQHHKGSEVHAFISADDGTEAPAKCHSLALLRTCKQVNQEAAQMFWACKEFKVMAGYTCSRGEMLRPTLGLSSLHAFLSKAQRQGAKIFRDIVFSWPSHWQLRAWETGRPELHLKVELDLVISLDYSLDEPDTICQKVAFDGLANSATTLQAAIAELGREANKTYNGKQPTHDDLQGFTSMLQELQRDLGRGFRRSLRRK